MSVASRRSISSRNAASSRRIAKRCDICAPMASKAFGTLHVFTYAVKNWVFLCSVHEKFASATGFTGSGCVPSSESIGLTV
jgi:hypothetical protein